MRTESALSYLDLYSSTPLPAEGRGGEQQESRTRRGGRDGAGVDADADGRSGAAPDQLPRRRSLVPRPGALVPLGKPEPAPETPDESALRRQKALEVAGVEADVRDISPRDVAGLGFELYAAGLLGYEEYAELAFQPELHPDYDSTIGALIGETAAPDRPRDFVRIWEERLAFEQRYNPGDVPRVKLSQRIVAVLRRLGGADATSA